MMNHCQLSVFKNHMRDKHYIFRSSRFTASVLTIVIEPVIAALDVSFSTRGIVLDISKVLDMRLFHSYYFCINWFVWAIKSFLDYKSMKCFVKRQDYLCVDDTNVHGRTSKNQDDESLANDLSSQLALTS